MDQGTTNASPDAASTTTPVVPAPVPIPAPTATDTNSSTAVASAADDVQHQTTATSVTMEEQKVFSTELSDEVHELILKRRGTVNCLPDIKILSATWNDVEVNRAKGEAITLFGLELQPAKVQKLKKLMGALKIKGRKKFQNSKYDMLRCIYEHWLIQRGNTTAAGNINANKTVGNHALGSSTGLAAAAVPTTPAVPTPVTATGTTNTDAVITTNTQLSPAIPQMNSESEYSLIHPVAGIPTTAPIATANATTATPSNVMQPGNLSIVVPPFLPRKERLEYIRKAEQRIEKEHERAGKKLKLEEARYIIEKSKERRERQLHEDALLEKYTMKISELRAKKKARFDNEDEDEDEDKEIWTLLTYYTNARKVLMESNDDGPDHDKDVNGDGHGSGAMEETFCV